MPWESSAWRTLDTTCERDRGEPLGKINRGSGMAGRNARYDSKAVTGHKEWNIRERDIDTP